MDRNTKTEQAPDLNKLTEHPDVAAVNLARAASAAYELAHPATPEQVRAAQGTSSVDLGALRRHLEEVKSGDNAPSSEDATD